MLLLLIFGREATSPQEAAREAPLGYRKIHHDLYTPEKNEVSTVNALSGWRAASAAAAAAIELGGLRRPSNEMCSEMRRPEKMIVISTTAIIEGSRGGQCVCVVEFRWGGAESVHTIGMVIWSESLN